MKKARIIILIVLLSLIGTLVTFGGIAGTYYLASRNNPTERAELTPKENQTIEIGEETYEAKRIVNYLVVGIDSTGPMKKSNTYNNTALNDFMCLVSFNITDKTYFLLPINRDTMVDIDIMGIAGKPIGTRYTQIAYAHTIGDGLENSFRNTCRAVSKVLLGLDIERFIGINMSTVPLINDFVGGVTITLDEDLTVLDSSWTEGATITLTSENCMKYIRARMEVSDGTQLSRMHRQQIYLEEVARKARTTEYGFSNLVDLLRIVSNYMCMDVTYIDMADVLGYVKEYQFLGIKKIEGTTQKRNNLIEFIPDPECVEKLVTELFYEKVESKESDE